jgi:hypothetical protein
MPRPDQYPHTYEGSVANGTDPIDLDVIQGIEVWTTALTLADFGDATAQWLEGSIGHMPTSSFYSQPNDESMELLPYLNPLNRSGRLVSTFSQPGCTADVRPFGSIMEEQRAAVSGFMDKRDVSLLEGLVKEDGEIAMVSNPPKSPSKMSDIVISRENGEDITFTGNVVGSSEIAEEYRGLQPALIRVLQRSFQVDLYDPEWGRNDRLWPVLARFFEATQASGDL